MIVGEQYECDYMPGETLTVVRMYNPRLGTIRAEKSEKNILFAKDLHSEPRLCLAHVANAETTLRKKEQTLWSS